ncbi:MAG: biopolymer transporter ExbD [Myxococcota bacterium]
MRFRAARRAAPGVNLTPLIDVLFIVLMFLVLTTTFRESTRLKIKLPEAETGEPLKEALSRLRVTVADDGRLSVEGRTVTLPALGGLFEAISGRDDAQIVVAADEEAEHGRVVEVMDLARRNGIFRISIETLRADVR